jgi:hypothetical protein
MIHVFVVMTEGHVLFIDRDDPSKHGKPLTCATSFWSTREEAEYCINRRFNNFGNWTPKRRWIEERDIPEGQRDQISNLDYNKPEYAEFINYLAAA